MKRVFLDVETTEIIAGTLPEKIFLIVCKDDKGIRYFKENDFDKFTSYINTCYELLGHKIICF